MAKRILHIAELRRNQLRRFYPLQLSFAYIALRRGRVIYKGMGQTVEMSSNLIRVKPLGFSNAYLTELIMAIEWPAKLPDGTGLRLLTHTVPANESMGMEAFRVLKHEFRTASRGVNGLGLLAGLRSWTSGDTPGPAFQPAPVLTRTACAV